MAMPPMSFSSSASSGAEGRQDAAVHFGAKNISFGSGSVSSLPPWLPVVAAALAAFWIWKRAR